MLKCQLIFPLFKVCTQLPQLLHFNHNLLLFLSLTHQLALQLLSALKSQQAFQITLQVSLVFNSNFSKWTITAISTIWSGALQLLSLLTIDTLTLRCLSGLHASPSAETYPIYLFLILSSVILSYLILYRDQIIMILKDVTCWMKHEETCLHCFKGSKESSFSDI